MLMHLLCMTDYLMTVCRDSISDQQFSQLYNFIETTLRSITSGLFTFLAVYPLSIPLICQDCHVELEPIPADTRGRLQINHKANKER